MDAVTQITQHSTKEMFFACVMLVLGIILSQRVEASRFSSYTSQSLSANTSGNVVLRECVSFAYSTRSGCMREFPFLLLPRTTNTMGAGKEERCNILSTSVFKLSHTFSRIVSSSFLFVVNLKRGTTRKVHVRRVKR